MKKENQREIKFRIWDKERKEWVGQECGGVMDLKYSGSCNAFMFDNDNFDIPEEVIWLQYTGLKDKNGKKIYEGDIATQHKLRTEHFGELNHEIIFYPDYCGFAVATMSEDGKERFIGRIEKGIELEVIGNIYENPELLNNK